MYAPSRQARCAEVFRPGTAILPAPPSGGRLVLVTTGGLTGYFRRPPYVLIYGRVLITS